MRCTCTWYRGAGTSGARTPPGTSCGVRGEVQFVCGTPEVPSARALGTSRRPSRERGRPVPRGVRRERERATSTSGRPSREREGDQYLGASVRGEHPLTRREPSRGRPASPRRRPDRAISDSYLELSRAISDSYLALSRAISDSYLALSRAISDSYLALRCQHEAGRRVRPSQRMQNLSYSTTEAVGDRRRA
jgi:hypothetical protein